MQIFKDMFGRTVEVGDLVVFSVCHRKKFSLVVGEIYRISNGYLYIEADIVYLLDPIYSILVDANICH